MKCSKGIVLFMITSLVITGCSILPKEDQALTPPLVTPARESTEIYEVQQGDIIKTVRGIGNFQSSHSAYHQFTGQGGRVEHVYVRAGDVVQAGDLLIQLDIEDLDVLVLKQELELEKAKNNLMQAIVSQDSQELYLRELELEIANLQYQKTTERLASRQLIAEIDGQVVFVENLKTHEMVHDNRVLVTIADTSQLRLLYEASNPSNIESVQVGMKAEITFSGQTYTGTSVQTPSSAPQATDRAMAEQYAKTLIIELDELPEQAEIGNTAEFNIITEHREDTLVIPRRGLRSYLGRSYVHIMDGQSRQELDVEIGIETSTEVEIIQGLQEGQLVILQ